MSKDSITQLLLELFDGKFEKELSDEDINRITVQINNPNVYYFFFNENEQKVAMAALYVVELLTRKLGVIEEVVTLKNYRNKGIGSALVKIAISKAKELNCDCVELTVREDKPDVQEFYKHLGFGDRNQRAMRMWLTKNEIR